MVRTTWLAGTLVAVGTAVALLAASVAMAPSTGRGTLPPVSAPSSVPPSTVAPATATTTTTTTPSAACIAELGGWSLSALADQTLMVIGSFGSLATLEPQASAGVGGVVLLGQPGAATGPGVSAGLAALSSAAGASGAPAPFVATDEEGGEVTRLADLIGSLPSARQMAAEWTPTQVEAAAARQGAAMRALGVTMDLAPVLDTAAPTDPVDAEASRSFSQVGSVAGTYGLAFAHGLEEAGVIAVAKHFPGLGRADADTDEMPATVPPLATLETNDLVPFEQAIGDGIAVVMVSNAIVPDLTGGLPASLAPGTYRYLDTTLGFDGVAMTDSLGAGAVSGAGFTQSAAALSALRAGADMVMVDASTSASVAAAIEQAVASGTLPADQLRSAVARVLSLKGVGACTGG